MENVQSFTAAVRGYHYYRRFWKPEEKQKLNCMHELNNPYDRFSIKLVTLNGETVGHLPKELPGITKFYLDRGTSMHVALTSKHYRRSPLVQGGMEIACLVVTRKPAIRRNTEITEKYLTLVKSFTWNLKKKKFLAILSTR